MTCTGPFDSGMCQGDAGHPGTCWANDPDGNGTIPLRHTSPFHSDHKHGCPVRHEIEGAACICAANLDNDDLRRSLWAAACSDDPNIRKALHQRLHRHPPEPATIWLLLDASADATDGYRAADIIRGAFTTEAAAELAATTWPDMCSFTTLQLPILTCGHSGSVEPYGTHNDDPT